MTSGSSATHKQNYASFADTTTSAEVLGHTSTSFRRLPFSKAAVSPQAESLAPSRVCTPTSTPPPLPARGSHLLPPRVSNGLYAGDVDGGDKDDGTYTSDLPRSLHNLQNGGDGEHHRELLHSSRQLISPPEQREGDQDFSPNSARGEGKGGDSDSEIGESDKAERWRDLPRTSFKSQGRSTMPTGTSRLLKLSPLRHQSGPRTDIATQSGLIRTSSPGTRAVLKCKFLGDSGQVICITRYRRINEDHYSAKAICAYANERVYHG